MTSSEALRALADKWEAMGVRMMDGERVETEAGPGIATRLGRAGAGAAFVAAATDLRALVERGAAAIEERAEEG